MFIHKILNAEQRVPFYTVASLMLFALLYIGILPWPWTTLPGRGLSLTLNLLVWSWTSVFCILLLLFPGMRHFRGKRTAMYLLAGCFLMSLPLIWSADSASLALYRLAGLWAFAAFFILLMQFPVRGGLRRGFYIIVVIAGLIQVLLSVWQIVFPFSAGEYLYYSFRAANGRPLGSLLQVNLLGSFLATALVCALWLAMNTRTVVRRIVFFLAVTILCAGVTLTESRTAWLAAFVTSVVLLSGIVPVKKNVRITAALFLAVGVIAGQGLLSQRPSDLSGFSAVAGAAESTDARPTNVGERLASNRQYSGTERTLMIRGALDMIKAHPLKGTGLASFEVRFPEYLNKGGYDTSFTVTVPFPHNEILYVWSEGGVLALGGLILWLWVWLAPFRGYFRNRRLSQSIGRGALTLPIMVHVMLEYPLYQSALHAITLLVMLRLAMPVQEKHTVGIPAMKVMGKGGLVLCLASVVFMVTGLQSAQKIKEAESFRLMDPVLLDEVINPYAQPERLLFDRAVSGLVQFNMTQNYGFLSVFYDSAEKWLRNHNDANMTASMMQISTMNENNVLAEKWRKRGCLSFRQDPRFKCITATTSEENNP
ncbi:Wzy polymerase domain-containing protein [Enterobacter sp. WCHEn045836]|uniref:Wzy polymerase domain-containing protein n=1 Tax=Enterobacter sp. WCHEn045836 TaxID=2497434 RepID=UPI001639FDDC|nr:Wzy polymerase domain-containing protein [Enterobacter sp. WCHEn045836]